jgi:hypothetical protein
MLVYLDLAIAVLKLVNSIINYFHDRGLIDQGRAQVIAENAAAISAKVAVRDKIKDQVDAMDDKTVDQELRDLEPPGAGGKS